MIKPVLRSALDWDAAGPDDDEKDTPTMQGLMRAVEDAARGILSQSELRVLKMNTRIEVGSPKLLPASTMVPPWFWPLRAKHQSIRC